MGDTNLPTERLYLTDANNFDEEARAFARGLIERGERPWFEVFYPAPEKFTPEEAEAFLQRQNNTYDAVELVGDTFVTLPPYSILKEGV